MTMLFVLLSLLTLAVVFLGAVFSGTCCYTALRRVQSLNEKLAWCIRRLDKLSNRLSILRAELEAEQCLPLSDEEHPAGGMAVRNGESRLLLSGRVAALERELARNGIPLNSAGGG